MSIVWNFTSQEGGNKSKMIIFSPDVENAESLDSFNCKWCSPHNFRSRPIRETDDPSEYLDDDFAWGLYGHFYDKFCPFTLRAYAFNNLLLERDRMHLAPSVWDMIIKKCHIAYQEYSQGWTDAALTLVAECYIPLLPGLETKCSLVEDYREGLKHVLDSNSAYIQKEESHKKQSCKNLSNFFDSITVHNSMHKKQQAAVAAISSQLTLYPASVKLACKAISLCPEEAKWHYYMAKALLEAVESDEYDDVTCLDPESELCHPELDVHAHVMEHITLSLELERDVPEAFVLMAKVLASGDLRKSNRVIENTLEKFPENAWVLANCAALLKDCQEQYEAMPMSFLMIEPLLRKALDLMGGDSFSLRYELGMQQILMGKLESFKRKHEEGLSNLAKVQAAVFLPQAKMALLLAEQGIDSSWFALPWPVHPNGPMLRAEGSSSVGGGMKGTNRKKKKKSRGGR